MKTEVSVDLSALGEGCRRGNGVARFTRLELVNANGVTSCDFRQGEPMVVRLTIASEKTIENVLFGFSFIAADGVEVLGSSAEDAGISRLESGESSFECDITPMILRPGRWQIRGAIFRHNELFDHIDDMHSFDVLHAAFDTGSVPRSHAVGNVYLPYSWTQIE